MTSKPAYNMPPLASWRTRIALALVIGTSFWIIGHDLYRARRFVEEKNTLASSIDNPFAVQQEDTTLRTAFGFFLLGGAGLVCMLMRPLGHPRWSHVIIVLGLLYFSWCCLSLMWSENPDVSIRKITILALMLLGSFGMAHQLELEDVCWTAVLIFGVYLVIGYVMELLTGTFRPWDGGYRFSGTVHPNDQGVISSLLVLAAASAPWHTTQRPWVRNVIIVAALIAAWLTGSRTAFAALAASAAFAMVLRQRGDNRALAIAAITAVTSIGLIGFGFLQAGTVHATEDVAVMGRTKEVSSLSGRLPLWDVLLHDANKRPLAGYGYGGYWSARRMRDLSARLGWHIPHAHNSFLELTLDTGLIGLVLYLIWALAALVTAFLRFQLANRPAELFLACVLIFGFVNSIAEAKFPESSVGTFIMFTSMAAMAMRKTVPRDVSRRVTNVERPWRLLRPTALQTA